MTKIMKHINFSYLLFSIILSYLNVYSISVVYNFRIAEITKEPNSPYEELSNKKYNLITLLFDQYLKTYNQYNYNYTGFFESFIYHTPSYYFRSDFAASSIREKNPKGKNHTFQPEDILLTSGCNFIINDRSIITTSGLFGIPTGKVVLPQAYFGYRQVGLGIQLDGFYSFRLTHRAVYGFRYIYFVPRSTNYYKKRYLFTIGHMIDFLLAYQYQYNKTQELEIGYSIESRFKANIKPYIAYIIKQNNYFISSFYFVYKHQFLVKNTINTLLFNAVYGFDNIPNKFSIKYSLTAWLAWDINF